MNPSTGCIFCAIADKKTNSHIVYQNHESLAFLDKRPLFKGHTILIPRQHISNLNETNTPWEKDFYTTLQILSKAVENAMESQGTFIAINNKVSQSVPHLHVHIIPRTKGDGLRGFFWPRIKYSGDSEMHYIAEKIFNSALNQF
ncbi:histidine triad (HIT) protein [Chitinispirillum alkaliphilum]|nr:histidine triad (HIT) protein [Chitinispirillum alkaliphilum]